MYMCEKKKYYKSCYEVQYDVESVKPSLDL